MGRSAPASATNLLTTFTIVLAGLALLEAFSYGLEWAWGLVFQPVPRMSKFLADQTRLLERLVDTPDLRERIHPTRGWEYRPGKSSMGD